MTQLRRILLAYPDYRAGVFGVASLPVGLGYIARAVELAGGEYEVIDLNLTGEDELFARLGDYAPAFFGLSMMSFRAREAYGLLERIKQAFPALRLVVGGPHVTANRDAVMQECAAIDYAVVGEGETTIVELLAERPPAEIPGLYYRAGADLRFAGDRPFAADLDAVPFPTYTGFALEKYGPVMALNSSRGCPYQCLFCCAPRLLGKKWRRRSATGMLAEFDYWQARGYRRFYFSDSNFCVDRERIKDFCAAIVARRSPVSFTADGLRADHVDRPMLAAMKAARFTHLTFGVESGSDRVLQTLRKGETSAQIEAAIATAIELGFSVTLFFVIGSPGEEASDLKASFRLALRYDVELVHFFVLTPLPGTEFFSWAREHGFVNETDNKYPSGSIGFGDRALLPTGPLSVPELTRWVRRARRLEERIQLRHGLRQRLLGDPPTHRRAVLLLFDLAARLLLGPPVAALRRLFSSDHPPSPRVTS